MPDPIIISSYSEGRHNADLEQEVTRLNDAAAWKDLSTIILTPAAGTVPTKVVASWMGMIKPPNNRTVHLWALGTEVGEAYSRMLEIILGHGDLSKWKYLLCLEHDNAPPPDGMVKLLMKMEAHPELSAIGGLYWTKGEGGVPQIWGDPKEHPINFRPQRPDPKGGLVECCGTGMGFTIFRLEMFKDNRLRRPWFKTTADRQNGAFTQDLYFWHDAHPHGFRCAVDCSVKVGHYDAASDQMW